MPRLEVPRRLLVLKPSSFGDIIHTLPAVARLHAAWPECRISWLVNPDWAPLLEDNASVAEIIQYPRADFRGWGGGLRMLRWLRSGTLRRGFDLALDFQGLLRTALAGRASQARRFIGLSDAREGASWLYQQTVVSPPQPVHALTRYLKLADEVVASTGRPPALWSNRIEFPLPTGQPVSLPEKFGGRFVLLHPYSRGIDKSLDTKVIDKFIRGFSNTQVVLVGRGPSDFSELPANCLNFLNQTNLLQLIWLMRRASFVVSVDSGPAHLAAALGRPMVAIHSWSDPRRVGPYRADAWVWKNGRLIQVQDLATADPEFFEPRPLALRERDVAEIVCLQRFAN